MSLYPVFLIVSNCFRSRRATFGIVLGIVLHLMQEHLLNCKVSNGKFSVVQKSRFVYVVRIECKVRFFVVCEIVYKCMVFVDTFEAVIAEISVIEPSKPV